MKLWKNFFYSFIIFSGILTLSLLIPTGQDTDDLPDYNDNRDDMLRLQYLARNIADRLELEIDQYVDLARVTRDVRSLDPAAIDQQVDALGRRLRRTLRALTETLIVEVGPDDAISTSGDRLEVSNDVLSERIAQIDDLTSNGYVFEYEAPFNKTRLGLLTLLNQDDQRYLFLGIDLDVLARGVQGFHPTANFLMIKRYRNYDSVTGEGADPRDQEIIYGREAELQFSGERNRFAPMRFGVRDDKRWMLDWMVYVGINPEVSPVGRPEPAHTRAPVFVLAFMISILAGLFTFLVLSRNDKLEQEVENRVRDLQSSQDELRAIVEGAPMAILGYDETNRIILWNPRCQQIFGYTWAEAEGRKMSELVATESPELKETLNDPSQNGSTLADLSWKTKRKDGAVIFCGGSATTVRYAGQDRKFVLLICDDNTERLRMKKEIERHAQHLEQLVRERTGELAESEKRYRELLSNARDAIMTIDHNQTITLFNFSAERTFGHSASEAIGRPIWDLLPKGEAGARMGIEPFLQSGQTSRVGMTREAMARRKNGELFPVEVALSVYSQEEKPLYTAIIRDVSERKEMDRKINDMIRDLQRAYQEMEQFSYVVSHDLKAPLRAVKNMSQFLLEDCEPNLDETGKDYLRRLQDAVARMSDLIDNLLDLSQISRSTRTEKEPVKMNLVIDKALRFLNPAENVTLNIDPELPTVHCSPAKFEQVFMNLISNGIKYNDKPQIEIEIGYQEKESEYRFSVKDNGIGIDKKYQQSIFEPFQRLHKHNEYEGTGIGLSIVKKIIQDHGGRLWVDSAVGRGTTFVFSLPKVGAHESKAGVA